MRKKQVEPILVEPHLMSFNLTLTILIPRWLGQVIVLFLTKKINYHEELIVVYYPFHIF